MFKVTPNGRNRLDIEMSGKLNAEDMENALDEFVSKSKNIKDGYLRLGVQIVIHTRPFS